MSTEEVLVFPSVQDVKPACESTLAEMLTEINGLSEDELQSRLTHEVQSRALNMMFIGGLLHRAESTGVAGTCPFLDWCEQEHGLSPGQVQSYRRAYKVAAHSGLDLHELSALDTYKLTKLLPQVIKPLPFPNDAPESPGNKAVLKENEGWLYIAVGLSRAELKESIAKAKGKPTVTAKQYVFKVQEDAETVDMALESIKKETDGKHVGAAALVDLATAYLSGVSKLPSLKAILKEAGPLHVLETFEQLWPEIDLKVTLP